MMSVLKIINCDVIGEWAFLSEGVAYNQLLIHRSDSNQGSDDIAIVYSYIFGSS